MDIYIYSVIYSKCHYSIYCNYETDFTKKSCLRKGHHFKQHNKSASMQVVAMHTHTNSERRSKTPNHENCEFAHNMHGAWAPDTHQTLTENLAKHALTKLTKS